MNEKINLKINLATVTNAKQGLKKPVNKRMAPTTLYTLKHILTDHNTLAILERFPPQEAKHYEKGKIIYPHIHTKDHFELDKVPQIQIFN